MNVRHSHAAGLTDSHLTRWPFALDEKNSSRRTFPFSDFFFFRNRKICVSWKNENLRMPDSAIFVVSDENEWPIIFIIFWVDRRSTPWLIQSLNQLTIPAEIRRFELNCLTIQRNAGIGWNWQRKESRTCWLRRSRFGNLQVKRSVPPTTSWNWLRRAGHFQVAAFQDIPEFLAGQRFTGWHSTENLFDRSSKELSIDIKLSEIQSNRSKLSSVEWERH